MVEARQVVVATGPFHVPFTPALAAQLDPDVYQVHSAGYRNPDAAPTGPGAGGRRRELRLPNRPGALRAPTRSSSPPEHGSRRSRSGRWVATSGGGPAELRLDRVTVESRLGRRLAGRDQRIGVGPRRLARHHGVRIRPRATSAAGRTVTFADGATADVDAVVWATGYTTNHSWIDVPEAVDTARTPGAETRRDTIARPVHPRPHLAAHPRLRATRLGRRRRRLPRRPDHWRTEPAARGRPPTAARDAVTGTPD